MFSIRIHLRRHDTGPDDSERLLLAVRQNKTPEMSLGVGRIKHDGQGDPWPAWLRKLLEDRFRYDPLNQDFIMQLPDHPRLKMFKAFRSYRRARRAEAWFNNRLMGYLTSPKRHALFMMWHGLPESPDPTLKDRLSLSIYEDFETLLEGDDFRPFTAVE